MEKGRDIILLLELFSLRQVTLIYHTELKKPWIEAATALRSKLKATCPSLKTELPQIIGESCRHLSQSAATRSPLLLPASARRCFSDAFPCDRAGRSRKQKVELDCSHVTETVTVAGRTLQYMQVWRSVALQTHSLLIWGGVGGAVQWS